MTVPEEATASPGRRGWGPPRPTAQAHARPQAWPHGPCQSHQGKRDRNAACLCSESLGGDEHLCLPASFEGLPGSMLQVALRGFSSLLHPEHSRTFISTWIFQNTLEGPGCFQSPFASIFHKSSWHGSQPQVHGDGNQRASHVLLRPARGVRSSASGLHCNSGDRGMFKGVPGDPTKATWSLTAAPEPGLGR